MTIDLVDGKAGKAHIDSDDRGSFNVGTMGPGCYVLNVKNKFALTMDSANSGTVDTGGLIMWGRYVHCTEPETITVENGSQNMKRNDLVVMRYTKTTDKIETASLVVVKGTAAASNPADPKVNTVDSITSTTTIADMPLYRIPLDGIAVGTPIPLFNVLAPMSELWDSVSLTAPVAVGKFAHCWSRSGVATVTYTEGYGSPTIHTTSGQLTRVATLPEGFWPPHQVTTPFAQNPSSGALGKVIIKPDGTINLTHSYGNSGEDWVNADVTITYACV